MENRPILGVKPNTPCIECRGKRPNTQKVWRDNFGPLPAGSYVLHRCDNRKCERPDHLFLGSCSDNMIDCSLKGRISRGVDRPLHVLNEDLVRQIRNSPQRSAGQWAFELKVSKRTILMVRNGVTWKHVQDQVEKSTS